MLTLCHEMLIFEFASYTDNVVVSAVEVRSGIIIVRANGPREDIQQIESTVTRFGIVLPSFGYYKPESIITTTEALAAEMQGNSSSFLNRYCHISDLLSKLM